MQTITAARHRTLRIQGTRLDTTAARRLLGDAEAAFKEGALGLVIDLGGVKFMDSLGISALVAISQRAPKGCRVVLSSLTPYAMTLARLTHLHEAFDIFADTEAAETSLRA
jgi:anti-sigma B factor antagonist